MASQLLNIDNFKVPPMEADQRAPCGGAWDDLTFRRTVAAAPDNDVIQTDWRMPEGEAWLIPQFRVYQDNGEGFNNVSIINRVQGRVLNVSSFTGAGFSPPTTINKFFDSTGAGGSVTYTLENAKWKLPPYFGPGARLRFTVYVDEALGWSADSVINWQFICLRYPEPKNIHEARKLTLPFGGWFDR